MIFDRIASNAIIMATRNASSSSTVLLAIILIITFPIWFAVGAALFGVVMGLFGVAIGVIAAIFGGLIALIALPFKLLFGWHSGWYWFPHFHFNCFVLFAVFIVAALIVRGRKGNQ